MNNFEVSQVVVLPADKEFAPEVRARVAQEPSPPAAAMRRLRIGRWLHYLGIHHWVLMRVYDAQSKRILNTGGHTCAFCARARL